MAATESAADRMRVYQSGGTCCTYCGRALKVDEAQMEDEAAVCGDCHEDKGERSGAEYRHVRRMRLAQQMLDGLGRR